MFRKKNENLTQEKEYVLVAVDPGKYLTKAIREDGETCSFRTKSVDIDSFEDVPLQGNSYKVEFEGKKMLIGDQGYQESYDVSKTALLHKVAVYTSIVDLLREDLEKYIVQLVVSCPISIFKDTNQKKEYKKYMRNDNFVEIIVNGKEYHITFDNVLVVPEGSGAIVKYHNLFKDNMTALVDIGGLNMNFSIYNYENNQCIFDMRDKNSFTRNLGNNELETTLINVLNSKLGTDINNDQASYILRNGGLKYEGKITDESVEVVNQVKREFVNRIDNEILKNGFDLRKMSVIFIGGTSLMLEDELQKKYKHGIITDEGQWAHVRGALVIGKNTFRSINGR